LIASGFFQNIFNFFQNIFKNSKKDFFQCLEGKTQGRLARRNPQFGTQYKVSGLKKQVFNNVNFRPEPAEPVTDLTKS